MSLKDQRYKNCVGEREKAWDRIILSQLLVDEEQV